MWQASLACKQQLHYDARLVRAWIRYLFSVPSCLVVYEAVTTLALPCADFAYFWLAYFYRDYYLDQVWAERATSVSLSVGGLLDSRPSVVAPMTGGPYGVELVAALNLFETAADVVNQISFHSRLLWATVDVYSCAPLQLRHALQTAQQLQCSPRAPCG